MTPEDQLLRDAVMADQFDASGVEKKVRAQIAANQLRKRLLLVAAAGLAVVFLVVQNRPIPSIYAKAAADHHREVVDNEQRNWRSEPSEIEALAVRMDLPPAQIAKLVPPGHKVSRGKLCRVDGRMFLHLVLSSNVSIFVQKPDATLRLGRSVWGVDLPKEHLAAFQTESLMALMVSSESKEGVWNVARYGVGVL